MAVRFVLPAYNWLHLTLKLNRVGTGESCLKRRWNYEEYDDFGTLIVRSISGHRKKYFYMSSMKKRNAIRHVQIRSLFDKLLTRENVYFNIMHGIGVLLELHIRKAELWFSQRLKNIIGGKAEY